MKLTVLGGGGVRSPFLAKSIVSNASIVGIDEIVFMDNDEEKLFIYGKIAMNLAKKINPNIKFDITCDARVALTDADFVITTLRVGGDEGRVSDERIALNYGVLGQETTGAGGFAMALRSVPVLIDYCNLINEVAKPDVLVFNFTNPSGVVTQALRSQGFNFVYGICDAPSEFIKQIHKMLDVQPEDFDITCFGLNHLSWFKDAKIKGNNVMDEILNHPKLYTDTEMRLFQPELTKISGDLLLNEYLYFYYYREQAIASINQSGKTRGETILEINNKMTEILKSINIDEAFDEAFKIFMTYYLIRENSYFSIESGHLRPKQLDVPSVKEMIETPDDGGYAGVALNFIRAYSTGQRTLMILSVPNEGAIEGLADDDVVEISCVIDKKKVTPIAVGKVNDMQMNLIKTIKYYERKTIDAILNKDRDMAIKALTVHPLINSYSLSIKLVDEYLMQYKDFVGEWN